jgi:predicted nucleic acid-binding protein
LTTLLVDAGIWVAARDPEDRFHRDARSLVHDFEQPVAALDLTLYEVCNAIGVRRGEPDEARFLCQLIARRCAGGLVGLDSTLVDSALGIAAEHGLTAYDAAYAAASRLNGWTLVSTDVADLVSKGLAVAPDAADYP